ncbi:MAG: alpha-amylase [Planctomycetes bacterium]|nr:alpha-amylase [Planctomycetota bacterium]
MTSIVFYFQVHQPYRLQRRNGGGTPTPGQLFDDKENSRILRRVAERCYLPMNAQLMQTIDETDGEFRCAFSISGTALDQMEAWSPPALASFVELAETGNVEFLAETSHHSLACVGHQAEFVEQVREHTDRIERLFGSRPTTFRNTELVIEEPLARIVEQLGFDALLGEGIEHLLGDASPHFPYRPRGCKSLQLLLRDYPFSDDIAFRFSNREWEKFPLFADTFASWLHDVPNSHAFIGLFMDYETFGEHQGSETGLFEFMQHLPAFSLKDAKTRFATPSEIAANHPAVDTLALPQLVSWADAERDVSAWLGNPMQLAAHHAVYEVAEKVRSSDDEELIKAWKRLTTSDHFYYMCTKNRSDGDVHEYFSPYYSPHDAFVLFMDALAALTERL